MDRNVYNTISKQCKDWAYEFLGSDFTFRESQLNCAINVINNVLNNVKTTIGEIPTGTGKSLIGFIIAGVLDKFYNKSTYILCSDTSLFKQYENDIKRYNLDFGCLCGKDNYMCLKNGQPFSSSRCQMQGLSIRYMTNLDGKLNLAAWNCSTACRFIQNRYKSHHSHVTVLTYQLWLSMMSDEPEDFEYSDLYKKRDLIICDEAHKLPDIVQNMFSPKIDIEELHHFEKLMEYADLTNVNVPNMEHFKYVFKIMKLTLEKDTDNESELRKNLFMCLNKFKSYMDDLALAREQLKNDMEHNSFPPKIEIHKFSKSAAKFDQDMHVMEEFIGIINTLGTDWMIPQILDDHTIVFNCAKESEMVKAFFHKNTKSEFLMSATIGNIDSYKTMIGSTNDLDLHSFEIESNWDFTKSPIYYNDNSYRLSFREKENNLPKVMQQIEEICENHKSEKGIIQTGSYEFSKYIWNKASPSLRKRLIFYNNAEERKRAIYNYESYFGKILIGPSLLEGLDFKDDLLRFLIVLKVPYPSLKDSLIQAKMNIYPLFYRSFTANQIIQGIGRGVRSKDDWCKSYILDGCFADLLEQNPELFNKKLKSRLQEITENTEF